MRSSVTPTPCSSACIGNGHGGSVIVGDDDDEETDDYDDDNGDENDDDNDQDLMIILPDTVKIIIMITNEGRQISEGVLRAILSPHEADQNGTKMTAYYTRSPLQKESLNCNHT